MDILMVAMHQRAFGKLERDNLGVAIRWHPLVDHMIDVAAREITRRLRPSRDKELI